MTPKEAFEKLIVNIMTGKLDNENKGLITSVEQALTELEELKRDVKRYFEIKNTIDKYERLNKKNEIPNELWVKFRYIKKAIMKLLKAGANE